MWFLVLGSSPMTVKFGFDSSPMNSPWVPVVSVYFIPRQFNVRRGWRSSGIRSHPFFRRPGSTVSPGSAVQTLHDHRLFPYRISSTPTAGIYHNLTKVTEMSEWGLETFLVDLEICLAHRCPRGWIDCDCLSFVSSLRRPAYLFSFE